MDEPTCPGCRELLKRVAELEAKLRELEARLGQNASNSSIPPSANLTDVYEELRGLEQILHLQHNPPLNKIGAISPTNPSIGTYLRAGVRFLAR